MASAGSWESIRRHGLLSTTALAERWGASSEPTLTSLRGASMAIHHPQHGPAVIRDQKPMHRESLELALGGRMTVEEWVAELNSRVFFFVQRESLEGLLNSPSYRRDEHDVVTVDMSSLVSAYGDEIELTDMNTGFAQRHNHKARGASTFKSISEYPHPLRDKARVGSSARELVELCIRHAVPDIVDHVVRVERMRRSDVLELVYSA
jgi:hypothetical protein